MENWSVCRLCLLTNAEPKKPLLDVTYNMIPFVNIYFELIGITFTEYPGFTGKICHPCENDMMKAYKFREKCMETEEKLKGLVTKGIEMPNIEFISAVERKETSDKHVEIKVEMVDNRNETSGIVEKDNLDKKMYSLKDLESKRLKCRKCSNIFRGVEMFKNHNCFKPGNSSTKSQESISTESEQKKLIQCELCDQTFLWRTSYNAHMDKHQNIKRYACKYCNEEFSFWIGKRNHVYKVHLKKNFCECPHCGKGFSKIFYMKDHIKEEHSDIASYQCHICGDLLKSRAAMRRHAKQHMKREQCSICAKWLKNREMLLDHIRIHHKLTCTVCSRKFTSKIKLSRHVKENHPPNEMNQNVL